MLAPPSPPIRGGEGAAPGMVNEPFDFRTAPVMVNVLFDVHFTRYQEQRFLPPLWGGWGGHPSGIVRTSNSFPVSPSFPSHLHTAEDYDPLGMLAPPAPPMRGGEGAAPGMVNEPFDFLTAPVIVNVLLDVHFTRYQEQRLLPPLMGGLGGAPKRRLRYRFCIIRTSSHFPKEKIDGYLPPGVAKRRAFFFMYHVKTPVFQRSNSRYLGKSPEAAIFAA